MRVGFLLLAVALLASTLVGAQDTVSDCVARQDVIDSPGDVEGRVPVDPPVDASAMDLLAVSMWRTPEGLGMSGTLAADPRADTQATYYYWISFEAETPAAGGNPATWTFQRTSTYDKIATMYWQDNSEYVVTWIDETFSFIIPWADFEAEYGSKWPMDIGSPRLSSSGPYMVEDPVGYVNYAASLVGWNDWAYDHTELVPLPECPADDTTPAAESASSSASARPPPPTASKSTSSAPAGAAQGAAGTASASTQPASDDKESPGLPFVGIVALAVAAAQWRSRQPRLRP